MFTFHDNRENTVTAVKNVNKFNFLGKIQYVTTLKTANQCIKGKS